MVDFTPIPQAKIGTVVYAAFRDDWELIETYHLVNGDLGSCVLSTVKEIDKVAKKEPLEFFSLQYGGKTIGFTVMGDQFLLSFGINIEYRSKDIVLDWWRQICERLNEGFVTWIFKKNGRAIDFLERNGMHLVEDNETYVTMLYPQIIGTPSNKDLCQQED